MDAEALHWSTGAPVGWDGPRTMALEYKTLRLNDAETDEGAALLLTAFAAEGWRVHTAYSPTHYLLERGSASQTPPVRAEPTPPTGPGRA